mmetsp:Transcript_60737/g.166413  ORF Transcript_60737/g.166413 Transcript_60737/m.166413 type:complete len:286 (+) Transcript_60737:3678-4535(+)
MERAWPRARPGGLWMATARAKLATSPAGCARVQGRATAPAACRPHRLSSRSGMVRTASVGRAGNAWHPARPVSSRTTSLVCVSDATVLVQRALALARPIVRAAVGSRPSCGSNVATRGARVGRTTKWGSASRVLEAAPSAAPRTPAPPATQSAIHRTSLTGSAPAALATTRVQSRVSRSTSASKALTIASTSRAALTPQEASCASAHGALLEMASLAPISTNAPSLPAVRPTRVTHAQPVPTRMVGSTARAPRRASLAMALSVAMWTSVLLGSTSVTRMPGASIS